MNPTEFEKQSRERELAELKRKAEFGAAILRLEGNKDFQTVFTDGLFKDIAAHYVRNLASDSFSEDSRNRTLKMLDAISLVQDWIHLSKMQAGNAMSDLDAIIEGVEY